MTAHESRKQARFRFYAELNDFLPAARRFVEFEHEFKLSPSVKDTIEALGVPHTEVDLIVVDGHAVDFSYRVRDGDRISVYPVFESLDISESVRPRPDPLREVKFVVDANLGQLARYLRLLGFDSLFDRSLADPELARASGEERRVLLTRDVGLLKRSAVTRGYFVRATDPHEQAIEVIRRFDLARSIHAFERCMECNGVLRPARKHEVAAKLEPGTRSRYDEFRECGGCGRVYWKGSHYERLARFVEDVARAASPERQ